MSIFKQKVSFRDAAFAPAKVHPVSNNKVRIVFDKAEDQETAMRKLQAVASLRAEAGRQRRPLLILKGISKDIPKEQILDIVKEQNQEVALALKSNDDLKQKFVRKNRRDDLINLVIEVSPEVRVAMLKKERLNIEYQRVHVAEFSAFPQCYKCLEFGHTQAKCEKAERCSYCALSGHSYKDCALKDDKAMMRCHNCHSDNIKNNRGLKTDHTATSVKVCPRIRAMIQRISESTNYGS
jgi:hypothetical protein